MNSDNRVFQLNIITRSLCVCVTYTHAQGDHFHYGPEFKENSGNSAHRLLSFKVTFTVFTHDLLRARAHTCR